MGRDIAQQDVVPNLVGQAVQGKSGIVLLGPDEGMKL